MRKYLSIDEVIVIHEYLIMEFGGSKGLANKGALESALMRPQSGYYKDIFEEAAALMESLAMNHPFVDGNKRVAFFTTDVFLRLNNYFIDCDNILAYEFFMKLFDSNNFNFENLLPWLKENIIKLKM
jgi:death-on-curing protein